MTRKTRTPAAKPRGAGKPAKTQRTLPHNTALQAQTRRMLSQHYRAKYGVK